MAITFPNSPSSGDTHTTSNGLQYTYDGEKWTTIGTNSAGTWTRSGTTVSLTTAGDDLNVDSGTLFVDASTNNVGVGTTSVSTKLHIVSNGAGGDVWVANGSGQNCLLEVAGNGNTPQTNSALYGQDASNNVYAGWARGAHTVLFGTSNTERLRITSDGKIGVGTSSPGARLHIANTGGNADIVLQGSASGESTINFGDTSDLDVGQILYNHTSNYMRFLTNTGERLRIDSSGNVGIGTTSPASILTVEQSTGNINLELHSTSSGRGTQIKTHNDHATFYHGLAGDTSGNYIYYTADSKDHVFSTSNVERLRIDSAGNVGIGESSPDTTLHIDSIGATTTLKISSNTESSIDFEDKGGSPKRYKIGTNISSNDGQFEIKDLTANAERLRIDSSGRVGIGIDSPGSFSSGANTLVVGTVSGSAGITINNGAADQIGSIFFAEGTGATGPGRIRYEHANNAMAFSTINSERMRIDSSGNVGIGTVPSSLNATNGYVLRLNGGSQTFIAFNNSAHSSQTSGGFVIGHDASNAYIVQRQNQGIVFSTTNTERMRIDSSGNVGIGMTSPSYKLEVKNDNSYGMRVGGDGGGAYYLELGQSSASGAPGINYTGTSASLKISNNGSEVARFDSSGQLCIGCTSFSTSVAGVTALKQSGNYGRMNMIKTASGARDALALYYSGFYVGGVVYSDTGVNYYSSSDYRLKENVINISDGIDRVKQLSPKRFNFTADSGTTLDGFLAHEAQAVVPEAVMGEKDGERMQSIDQSKLVPLLTAALKEVITELETLKAEVAALKSA